MVDLLIAFRSRGWSGSAETVGTWRAIECDTLSASWTRGSSEHRGLLMLPEATQAGIEVYDPERKLDPANTAGPYYGEIDVGSDIRLTFATRQVFIGRITTLGHRLEMVGDLAASIASISAVEHQQKLANVNLRTMLWPDSVLPEEFTANRVTRILDLAGVATGSGQRDIEAGGEILYDTNMSETGGIAWDQLVHAMRGELGTLEYADGVIRTRNRHTVWSTVTAPTLQLGCHPGAIPLLDAEFATLQNTVRNSVQGNVHNNDQDNLPVTDAASQAKWGLRTFQEDDLGVHLDGLEAWKAFFLAKMKQPMRSWRVSVRPQTQAQIDAIETTPLYTGRARVTIDSHGTMIDRNLRLVGLEWAVDPAGSLVTLVLGDEPATPAPVSTYRTTVMGTSGLVGYWRLGEASGTTASSETGARHGTYTGSPTLGRPGALPADANTAATFAASKYVTVPHHATLNLGNAWTIEAWIKLATVTSAAPRGILGKGPGGYYLRVGTTGYLELVKSDGAIIHTADILLPAGVWVHVAGTRGPLANDAYLYVNGVGDSTTTVEVTADTAHALTIGADMAPGGASRREFFVGDLDEVSLYNRALTGAEIQAHYYAR